MHPLQADARYNKGVDMDKLVTDALRGQSVSGGDATFSPQRSPITYRSPAPYLAACVASSRCCIRRRMDG